MLASMLSDFKAHFASAVTYQKMVYLQFKVTDAFAFPTPQQRLGSSVYRRFCPDQQPEVVALATDSLFMKVI